MNVRPAPIERIVTKLMLRCDVGKAQNPVVSKP
jgi:hypothetical protein